MKHEFHAHYPFAIQDDITQAAAIGYLARKRSEPPARWLESSEPEDDWARLAVLSQAIATGRKEEARAGLHRDPSGYKFWLEQQAQTFLQKQIEHLTTLGLVADSHSLPDLSLFPAGSWVIHFTFTLTKPYISKDDTDFYIIDNPVKKEWVFKVPYIAPSQWKGALRSTMMQQLVAKLNADKIDEQGFIKERIQLYRLFGNEKDGAAAFLDRACALHRVGPRTKGEHQQDEWDKEFKKALDVVAKEFEQKLRDIGYKHEKVEGFQGHVHFYPTYFDKIGLEVMNPHERKTGAGKQPIYFECVPVDAQGSFTLLYVPLTGKELDAASIRRQSKADVESVAKAIKAMMTQYGFGAKTSSGFGIAKRDASGWIRACGVASDQPSEKQPPDSAQTMLDEFLKEYPQETFELSGKEWMQKHSASRKERKRYLEAKNLFEKRQVSSSEAKTQLPPDFNDFDEMVKRAREIATVLTTEDNA